MKTKSDLSTRAALAAIALVVPAFAAFADGERATFLTGQYATAEQCAKLRKIEDGTPRNVGTAPELLDDTGFHGWEHDCAFTKVFEHKPGKSWAAMMICSDGMSMKPELFAFFKEGDEDSFEVSGTNDEQPEVYARCDAKKGK
ncbi:MAG: hypothetical protein K2Y42_04705 [Hyphomicrobium sp.]|jgi:hypothetical protein|uniref:hypothetical protein n=1 Tax=Hyphomicrobium sp. TaxID=82 RepID=UPI0025BCF92A|nr:hypothetical protein [Hyphomicrobium sp.]MBX9862032.1 hypothetical protein [Hyphomicrobium sp.]